MNQSYNKSHQTSAIIIGMATSFVCTFGSSALNLSIPALSAHFHMGASSVGWILTIYMLIIAAFSIPFGKLGDATSCKMVLLVGTGIFAVASFVAIFMPTGAAFLVIRSIQAIGAAMLYVANMPIAMMAFPPEERGKAIGLVVSGTYIGLACGPVVGGLLNNYLGWQSIFILVALIAAFAFILCFKGIPMDRAEKTEDKTDRLGNLLIILMLSALIYGLTSLNSVKFGWMFLIAAIILFILFVIAEHKASNPVIDITLFTRDRVFTLSNLTALFNYSATYALGYLMAIYLQVVMGFPSQIAGIIMIAEPFFMAILSPKMGKLSDRIAPYKLASLGMGVCAVGLAFFVFIQQNTPIWVIILALSITGVGIALFSSPNTNVIMGCVKPSQFAVTNSITATMRTVGQSTCMAIITLIVTATIGNVSLYDVHPEDMIHTVHIGFTIFTVLCIIGIFMSLTRRKKQ